MRLLLDSHIFPWCVDHDPKLSAAAWSMIETADAVYVSSASLWEASIEYQLGKLSVEPERLASQVWLSAWYSIHIRRCINAYQYRA
jgi:PIN domain nuclease of toxin-antitoxin system